MINVSKISKLVICLLLGLFISISYAGSIKADPPLQISEQHFDAQSPCGTFYSSQEYTFNYGGGEVYLSGNPQGDLSVYTDDVISIQITRPDQTTDIYTQNYGNGSQIVPTPPVNLTNFFQIGENKVVVTMEDLFGPFCNSSEYWLVEYGQGQQPPSPPDKPNILPRNVWGGPDEGEFETNNPKYLVVHHAESPNYEEIIGTELDELIILPFCFIGSLQDLGFFGARVNVQNCLDQFSEVEYLTIRDTWKGQIFRIYMKHRFKKNYGDIGYHYLIDPNGNIYQGRWYGAHSDEAAGNKGVHVDDANTSAVGITLLGTYGRDPDDIDAFKSIFDGGVQNPSNPALEATQELVNWLAYKYGINPQGTYQIPQQVDGLESCRESPENCFIPTIVGHRDVGEKTHNPTVCPGDNLYSYVDDFRSGSPPGSQPRPLIQSDVDSGLILGTFSPVLTGITDPQGRKVGYDPLTAGFVNEISGSISGSHTPSDRAHDIEDDEPYWIILPEPVNGVYHINLKGSGTGEFELAVRAIGTESAMLHAGTTIPDQLDEFQIIYDNSDPENFELWHDNVPPVTVATLTCNKDQNGLCIDDATITLTATDEGSGVDYIECSLNAGQTWEICGDENGGTLVLEGNGLARLEYRSIDRVENVEEANDSGPLFVNRYTLYAANSGTSLYFGSDHGLDLTGDAHTNGFADFAPLSKLYVTGVLYSVEGSNSSNARILEISEGEHQVSPRSLLTYPMSYFQSEADMVFPGNVYVDTNQAFQGSFYVQGDLTLENANLGGVTLFAVEGDVNETNIRGAFEDSSGSLMLYSTGNVVLSGLYSPDSGLYYAPNGVMTLNRDRGEVFNGSFVAGTLHLEDYEEAEIVYNRGAVSAVNESLPTSLPVFVPGALVTPNSPGAPTLNQPTDGAHQASSFTLKWNAATDATAYQLQVSSASDFSGLVTDIYVIGVEYAFNGSSDQYYWRVKALNKAGESNWSSTRSFIVD